MSSTGIDKFEEKEMMMMRQFLKDTKYDQSIHHIPQAYKILGGGNEKIMGLFKTNTTQNYYKPKHVNVCGSGKD